MVGRTGAGVLVICVLITLSQTMNELEQFQEGDIGYSNPVFTIYFNHSCLTVFGLVAIMMQSERSFRTGWNALLKEKGWSRTQAGGTAVVLSILYFIPNVGWAAGLGAGSISLFTLIAQSMSGWVLIIDCCARRKWPNMLQVVSVCMSLAGVVVISYNEVSNTGASDTQLQAVLWALLFTVGTAVFEVYWGLHFTNKDSLHDIMLMLGMMGFINAILLWPFLFTAQTIGISDGLPNDSRSILCVLGVGLIATMYNLAFMGGLAVTSPLFITAGMLLLLPVSIVMDTLFTAGLGFDRAHYLGCAFIVCGFTGLVWDEHKQHASQLPHGRVSTAGDNHMDRTSEQRPHEGIELLVH